MAVTGQRRRYRGRGRRIELALSELEPAARQRAPISDAYLAALLQLLPDPVLSIDERGSVLSWNPAAERAFGARVAEGAGRPVVEVLGAEAPEELAAVLERSRQGDASPTRSASATRSARARVARGAGGAGGGGGAARALAACCTTSRASARYARALEAQAEELQAQRGAAPGAGGGARAAQHAS